MGQQPNIELELADLPRPSPHPAAARRWKPARPGDLSAPSDMPWGGAFGTIGPDAGYAKKLLSARHFDLEAGEDHHAVEAAITALSTARASHFGRAPIAADIDVAAALLGLDSLLPEAAASELAAWRRHRLAGAGHDYEKIRAVVAAVPADLLDDDLASVRSRIASGERPAGAGERPAGAGGRPAG